MAVRKSIGLLGRLCVAVIFFGGMVGAVAFFALKNFDLNVYRAGFEQDLSLQTGCRVELGAIQLKWGFQPEFWIDTLKFYTNDPKRLDEKLFQSGSLRIRVDPAMIWRKCLFLSQISIQNPELFLRQRADGSWNWDSHGAEINSMAFMPRVDSPLRVGAEASIDSAISRMENFKFDNIGIGGWRLGVGKIVVHGGNIQWVNKTVQSVSNQEIKQMEIETEQRFSQRIFHLKLAGCIFNAVTRNLEVEGDLDVGSKTLDFVLYYGPDKVQVEGVLKLVDSVPYFDGAFEVRSLDLEPVIPASFKSGEYVSGVLSAQGNLSFRGTSVSMIERSLKGQGRFEIREGSYKNRNLNKEVFDRLAPVVAIAQVLSGELPAKVNEIVRNPDTPFEILKFTGSVDSGSFKWDQIVLVHPDYRLSGGGGYGILDQRMDSTIQIVFSESISKFFAKKIRELELLEDQKKQISIPFRFGGVLPNTAVQLNLQYVTAKLFQGGSEQFVGRGFVPISKIIEPKNDSKKQE